MEEFKEKGGRYVNKGREGREKKREGWWDRECREMKGKVREELRRRKRKGGGGKGV